MSNLFATVVRLVAGCILLNSGTVHLLHPYPFTSTIASYRLFPESVLAILPFAVAAIIFVVGLFLVLSDDRKVLWLATALFLSFVLLQGQALARGMDIDCGCFGYSSHQIGIDTLMLPGIAAACCIFVAWRSHHASVSVSSNSP